MNYKKTERLLLFALFLMATLTISAQGLTRNYQKVPIKAVLDDMESICNYSILYKIDEVGNKVVTCNFKNASASEVLSTILGKGLVYTIEGKMIVISKPKQQSHNLIKKKISGTIYDERGEPMIGATVSVEGKTVGYPTGLNGRYEIEATSDDVLIFNFLGCSKEKVKVGKRTVINVTLKENSQVLNEVVVTGYQTISKERATGAFDIVGKKDLDKPSTSIAQRLIGVIPGLAASQDPDGGVSFVIRGQGGLISNTAPLLVVDGFPINGGFNTINPNDVESVSVLKDAAAASIWGARASNGVIVVTTKKSKEKKMNVEFSAQMKIGSKTDVDYLRNSASSADMVAYEKSIFGKYGIKEIGSNGSMENLRALSGNIYTQAAILHNKYAFKEITEQQMNDGLNRLSTLDNTQQIQDCFFQIPIYQQYNLSFSSGNDRMSNFVSMMYSDDAARYKRNKDQDFQLNYRGKMSVFKWLDINLSSSLLYTKSNSSQANLGDVVSLAPYDMILNQDGTYANLNHRKFYAPMIDAMVPKDKFPYPNWEYNPADEMYNRDITYNKIIGRFQAEFNFKLLKGLTFNSKIQYERIQNDNRSYYDEKSFYVRNIVNTATTWNGNNNAFSQNIPSGSILQQGKSVGESYNFRNQLNFNRTIAEKHAINAIAGVEISQYTNNGYTYSPTYGYDHEHLTVGIFPNGTKGLKNWLGKDLNLSYINSYNYHRDRFFSAYANFAYTYDERYSLSGSIRTDASNFITDDPSYRYSPFWSVGLSWNAMNEEFMKPFKYIDYLKPRVTFGCNGNSDSSTSVIPLITMKGYNQQSGELEAAIWSRGNPTLRWELTNTLNLGVDFSFLKSKIYGKIDYYSKQGKDILGDVSIPMVNGATSATFNNAAISNHGIELMIGSEMSITKDLKWNGSVNFAYNKNEVTKLLTTSMPYWWLSGEGADGVFVEGKPIGQLYSYVYGGVKNLGTADNPKYLPTIKLKDDEVMPLDGSTTYSGFDFLEYQGTTIAPYNWGMNNTFSYKGIDLSFTITSKMGHVFKRTGFNYPGRGTNPNKFVSEVVNGNPEKIVPMPYQPNDNLTSWNKARYMSYLTTSANNVRLQELTVSYNLSGKMLANLKMNRFTFYLQGNNLFSIKKIEEDPEYLYGGYRLQPSYTVGIKCGF